jgi:Di-sulfide bridge nucleocytoplasmic transport domain
VSKPPPSPYRAPSFTTPRKPLEVDFSSGPENPSSPEQADNEDTPEAPKPAPITFTANKTKPAEKRNSLFGLYGRFAPSPSRSETAKPGHSNVLIRRVQKRRRREQNLGRQLVRARPPSGDTSEDEQPPQQERRNPIPPVHEVGYMAGLFTFIESFPHAPSLLAKYLQLFFNAAIILGCLYAIYSFWTTIQADVNRASEEAAAETLAEMAACAKGYVDNRCAGDGRLPALETVCANWELCMNRDPNSVKRAKLSAHTFAEILNSFVEPISLKTMVSLLHFS